MGSIKAKSILVLMLMLMLGSAQAGNISPGVTDSVGANSAPNTSPGITDQASTASPPQAPTGSGNGGSGGSGGSGSSVVICESLSNIESTARLEKDLRAGQETVYTLKSEIIPEVRILGANNEFEIPVRVDILKGATQCDGATDNGAYKYFNINAGTQRIQSATFILKLPKSLGDSIIVMRWNKNTKEWQEVSTTLQSQDNGYNYYQVSTPGFSNFAVVPGKAAGAIEQPRSVDESSAVPLIESEITPDVKTNAPVETATPINFILVFIVLAIVGIIAAGIYYLRKDS